MAGNRSYTFGNTVIESIQFQPVLQSGKVRTDFNFVPELNDGDNRQLRILCEINIRNEDADKEILSLKTHSYFLTTDNFGEFNLDNPEEHEIVHLAFKDIKFFMHSIIRNTDMDYLELDFGLDIEKIDYHENK